MLKMFCAWTKRVPRVIYIVEELCMGWVIRREPMMQSIVVSNSILNVRYFCIIFITYFHVNLLLDPGLKRLLEEHQESMIGKSAINFLFYLISGSDSMSFLEQVSSCQDKSNEKTIVTYTYVQGKYVFTIRLQYCVSLIIISFHVGVLLSKRAIQLQ